MSIVLSGPPFSGKTTIGNILAKRLHRQLINTDSALEKEYSLPCPELFKLWGKDDFRRRERAVLESLFQLPQPCVISLGGGTLLSPENARLAMQLGCLIALQCAFEVLLARLEKSGRMPAYVDPQDIIGSFKKEVLERETHCMRYAHAVLDVSSLTPEDAAEQLIRIIQSREQNQMQ